MSGVHVVVPAGIDDPTRPSGGNTYDRKICDGLVTLGWSVQEYAVPGRWPWPDPAARAHLARALGGVPDGGVVLLDGLVASAVPEVLVPHGERLRLVVLVHMPLGEASSAADLAGVRARERRALGSAAAIVTTSGWTRRRLLDRYALPGNLIHVAAPGTDSADLAPGSVSGRELLCVAAVTPPKGHDVLLEALAAVADLPWRCTCVGSLAHDRDFVDGLRARADQAGIAHRVRFTGPLTGEDLAAVYARSDLLVLASRAETYGMVVTEALARGLPVVASSVGGVPEALSHGQHGTRPGLLVPAGDAPALAGALRCWLSDAARRQRLRHAARSRRTTLPGWEQTSSEVSRVLAGVAGGVG